MAGPVNGNEVGEFVVHLDVPITRRKHWCTITSPNGQVIYTSRFPSAALGWLAIQGVDRYVLSPNPHRSLAATPSGILVERKD